jgi:Ran GTPase-activating protein (RanGAP) involved in mRNA processing and transport
VLTSRTVYTMQRDPYGNESQAASQASDFGAACQLSTALQHCKQLSCLDLSRCRLQSAGAKIVTAQLQEHTGLTILHVADNALLAEGSHGIAGALLANRLLSALDVSGNKIGDQGAGYIGDAMRRNRSLSVLNVSRNCISDQGVQHLLGALRTNDCLVSVDLLGNQVERATALALLELKRTKPTLRSLCGIRCDERSMDCSSRPCSGGCVLLLIDELRDNSVLCSIRIDKLALPVQQLKTLPEVDLSEYALSDKEAVLVAGMLRFNTGLKVLRIGAEPVPDADGQKAPAQAEVQAEAQAAARAEAPAEAQAQARVQLGGGGAAVEYPFTGANALACAIAESVQSTIVFPKMLSAFGGSPLALSTATVEADFRDRGLGGWEALCVASFLPKCRALYSLHVGKNNGVPAERMAMLAQQIVGQNSVTRFCGMPAHDLHHDELSVLELPGQQLGVNGITLLSGYVASSRTLAHLDISNNGLEAAGARAFASALGRNSSLQRLRFGGDYGGKVATLGTAMVSADFAGFDLRSSGLGVLAAFLPRCAQLSVLNVLGNSIATGEAQQLLDVKKRSAERAAERNRGGMHDCTELASLCGLGDDARSLLLANKGLGKACCALLGQELSGNVTLRHLDIAGNQLENDGALPIAQALSGGVELLTLNIAGNGLGGEGAMQFSKYIIANTTMTTLNIADNQLKVAGALHIAKALGRNHTLTNVNVAKNWFDAKGAKHFAKVLETNEALCILDISSSSLYLGGCKAICQVLKQSNTLTSLSMGNNRFQTESALELADMVKTNTGLTHLDISNNWLCGQRQSRDSSSVKVRGRCSAHRTTLTHAGPY